MRIRSATSTGAAPGCAASGHLVQPATDLLRAQRPGDQLALAVVATGGGQDLQRGQRLDALGHHRLAQAVRQPDGRGDDGRRTRVADHPGHERPVELELVERQLVQVGQRRVAGAVVVHRDAHAEGAHRMQHVEAAIPNLHDRALGDLQDQRRGRQPELGERGGDAVGEIRGGHAGRHVDRHRQLPPGLPPGAALRQRLAQHDVAQRPHQPGPLHQRQELVGPDLPEPRMAPAHQQLQLIDPTRAQVQLGLVAQQQRPGRPGRFPLAARRRSPRATPARSAGCAGRARSWPGRRPAGCPRTWPRTSRSPRTAAGRRTSSA